MVEGCQIESRKNDRKVLFLNIAGLRWTISANYREALLGPDGLRLEDWIQTGQATIVKQGPHRVVYRVELPEVSFYLKHNLIPDLRTWLRQLIRPSKARLEFQRALEVSGCGISTIEPLAIGESSSLFQPGESYLITKSLDYTKPLNEFLMEDLTEMDPIRHSLIRKRLAFRLGEFIARLHNHGILHHDFHCGNILIRIDENDFPILSLVDLQAVQLRGKLGWNCSRKNLIILNRWLSLRTSRTDRLRFWLSYRRHRENRVWQGRAPGQGDHRIFFRDIARELETATRHSNESFWRKRESRWLKATRHNRVVRTPVLRGFAVTELDQKFLGNLVSSPDAPFAAPDTNYLKKSQSAKVIKAKAVIAGKEQNVVYKKFEVTHWLDPVRALFRPTGAMRSWFFGHSLLERNLPAPKPLAVFHRVRWGFLREGYLLMEMANDCVGDIRDELNCISKLESATGQKVLRGHINQLAKLIRELHGRHLANRDLKAANILVTRKSTLSSTTSSRMDVPPQKQSLFTFIDPVGFSCRKKISTTTRVKNLARLHASFFQDQRITRTDKLRFLRVYFQWGLFGREGWKDWWRWIEQATLAKIQKNLRNKRKLG